MIKRLRLEDDQQGLFDREWNGVCACGKEAMDGVRCKLGATHQPTPAKSKPVRERL